MNRAIITATLMMGTLMSSLDSSIVNVTLPTMQGNLGASSSEITWVSSAYMLANVIFMPLVAFLGALCGRKRLYLTSVVVFTFSSLLCGMAWDLRSMVVFRLIQGAAGGVLIPVAQTIIREIYTKEEQGMAMGIFGMGVILGPTIGPTLGGWITDNLSWQWVFYINLPVGVLVALSGFRCLSDPAWLKRPEKAVDFAGILFMATGLGSLQLVLEKGQEKSWFDSSFIIVFAILAFVGIGLFIWRELVHDSPVVDIRILKNRELFLGTFLGALQNFGLFGSLFLLPQLFQNVLGYSAELSGWAMSPRGLAIACVMPFVGRIYNKVNIRFLVACGLLLCSTAFYEMSRLSPDSSGASLFWPQIVQGIGLGVLFVTLSTLAYSTLEVRDLPQAAGLNNLLRQVASSVSTAIFASQLERGTNVAHSILSEHVTALSVTAADRLATLSDMLVGQVMAPDKAADQLPNLTSALVGQGMPLYKVAKGALSWLNQMTLKQASLIAYNRIFFMVGLLFLLAVPLVFLIRKGGSASASPGDMEI